MAVISHLTLLESRLAVRKTLNIERNRIFFHILLPYQNMAKALQLYTQYHNKNVKSLANICLTVEVVESKPLQLSAKGFTQASFKATLYGRLMAFVCDALWSAT